MDTGNRGAGTPVKIAAVGLDERSVSRLSAIFRMVYRNRCVFTREDDAVLAIADLDSEPDAWVNFRKHHPELPAIVLSTRPTRIEGTVHVGKPAKLDALRDAIFGLATGLPPVLPGEITTSSGGQDNSNPHAAGEAPGKGRLHAVAGAFEERLESRPRDGRTAPHRTNPFFRPEDYLLGRLQQALADADNPPGGIQVQCGADRHILLLPRHGLAFTDMNESQLRNLSRVSLQGKLEVHVSEWPEDDPAGVDPALRRHRLDWLLWLLALATARGRVPEGTRLDQPAYLRCWPNFTRLPPTPEGLRIAAAWAGQPRPLDELAGLLGVEPALVYGFYSAAATTGLAGQARRRADRLVEARRLEQSARKPRGLLSAILRRLGARGAA